ncbi:hypothetical protein ACHAWO_004048 [Cyclotella atomus]|uniref:Mitochondrial inner membrane protease subunit n=1 Tax=Cyclotella atomus TaxID=382360 RepID=A0ABD3N0Y7_9STRA
MRSKLVSILWLTSISMAASLITSPPHLHPVHSSLPMSKTWLSSSSDSESDKELTPPLQNSITDDLLLKFRTASSEGFGTRARNVASTCQVGDIVVPLCGNMDKRQSLASRGVYPGVEYVICDISDSKDDAQDIHQQQLSRTDRIATIRPAYPLREHLERSDWPISVPLSDVPLWLSKTTYEAGTALGTLMLSGSFLATAAIVASVLRLAVIPSESMIPALMPGDVVLVTRSIFQPKAGDVVFFDPPPSLDKAIANSKIGRAIEAAAASSSDNSNGITPSIISTKGKQFIKRVVAVPGESVGVYNSNPYVFLCNKNRDQCKYRVDRSGQYSRPDVFPDESWNRVTPTISTNFKETQQSDQSSVLGKNEFFVAGDNGYRSVDSRVWGPLERQQIFGTAQFIVFPPSHAGRIPAGNIQLQDTLQ